jgi:hypothetical protein
MACFISSSEGPNSVDDHANDLTPECACPSVNGKRISPHPEWGPKIRLRLNPSEARPAFINRGSRAARSVPPRRDRCSFGNDCAARLSVPNPPFMPNLLILGW